MKLQNDLRKLYEELKSNIDLPRSFTERLSAPLLIYPTKRWVEADKRVLVVGQETFGWGGVSAQGQRFTDFEGFLTHEDSVKALFENYSNFEFAFGTKWYGSPFWCAYRQIRQTLDKGYADGINSSVLWTNLFMVDFDNGSVLKSDSKQRKKLQEAFRGRLTREIEILKPNAIIFFTGPNYNFELDSEFDGVVKTKFNEHDVSRSARLEHKNIGDALAIRTYHPRYLRTSKQWHVVDNIAKEIFRAG